MSSKARSVKLAKENKIIVPRTYKKNNLKFTLVLRQSNGEGGAPCYIFSKKGFNDKYKKYSKNYKNPLIQQFIIGEGYGAYGVCRDGVVLQSFFHKRLIEENPLGSGSSRCESIPWNNEMKSYLDIFVKETNYSGPIMLEFKRDKKGKFWFIECNARFWGSLQLSIDSGINFPYLLYLAKIGMDFKERKTWKIIKSRSILSEFSFLRNVLKGRPELWGGTFPRKIESVFRVLLGPWKSFYVFDGKDLKPFFRDFFKKNKIKAMFHTHSKFSDGKHSIYRLKKFAKSRNVNLMFMTEHLEMINRTKWGEYVKECINQSDARILFVPCFEINSTEGPHFIIIGNKKYPEIKDKSIKGIEDFCKKNNFPLILAHSRQDFAEKTSTPLVEIWNSKNNVLPFGKKSNKICIGGNDLHNLGHGNFIFNYFNTRDYSKINKMLLGGDFISRGMGIKMLSNGKIKGSLFVVKTFLIKKRILELIKKSILKTIR